MAASDSLIETTILVDVLKGKREAVAWVNEVSVAARWVSVVTAFELLAGCRNRREQRAVMRELEGYRLLLLTEEILRLALRWFERLSLSRGVGVLDSLIAATGLHHRLPNATLNVKHFRAFPGLRVVRPY
jgi:predicted nucleic acid-binding protein